jgi:hypothetical protein
LWQVRKVLYNLFCATYSPSICIEVRHLLHFGVFCARANSSLFLACDDKG